MLNTHYFAHATTEMPSWSRQNKVLVYTYTA